MLRANSMHLAWFYDEFFSWTFILRIYIWWKPQNWELFRRQLHWTKYPIRCMKRLEHERNHLQTGSLERPLKLFFDSWCLNNLTRLVHLQSMKLTEVLVNMWSLLFQKSIQVGYFDFFHCFVIVLFLASIQVYCYHVVGT